MAEIEEKNENATLEEDLGELANRRQKLKDLVEAGNDPFEITKFERTARAEEILADFEAFEGKTVTVAGRMVSRRVMGKASFGHLTDGGKKLQVYFRRDDVGEAEYAAFKKWDIGDIIGVTGFVFKTQTGETSVHAQKIVLLSKALRPLPEKYHGLTNTDLRYRKRYVDLIVNPEVMDTFVKRSKIISCVRNYMESIGFIEVETPVLNSIPGGANARPFVTHHNALDIDMYMRIATELYLKRLIVGGFDKVFEIGRIFRNEGMDVRHNPEFTTIELYQAYADYNDMMDITEGLFRYCAQEVLHTEDVTYQGQVLHFGEKWPRLTMIDAVKKYTGIDFEQGTTEELIAQAKKIGVEIDEDESWGKALYEVFDQKVEEKLIQPVFIIDYPVEVSPLAKRKPSDKRLTERFECFMMASEMGNAFSELNDPIDQRGRFEQQARERAKGDDEAQFMDEDFVHALEYGMPPTGGLGIGIDRMVMMLTDNYSIRDVLLFPTMKPNGK